MGEATSPLGFEGDQEMKSAPMSVEKGFRVRAMSPLGSYPADSFIAPSAALVVDAEICFSIVRITKKESGFSEVDDLNPSEIPLLGCITLAGPNDASAIRPYPSCQTMFLESKIDRDLNAEFILDCKARLLHQVRHDRDYACWPAGAIHKLPVLGGLPYIFKSSQHLDPERLDILRRLEAANPVLLRGVSTLIKAGVVWNHGEFKEAACLYLWIALDAAFSLTLEKLREEGFPNPTSQDAADYVAQIDGYEGSWEKFFERDYNNRISTIHPGHKYGPEARPTLCADDFLDLYDELMPLFQHIVLNY
jgi:hypothetical protein